LEVRTIKTKDMKKIITLFTLFAFMVGIAQETTNKKETTTKVKTTVSDNLGEETVIKETTKTEKQKMALTNYDGENFSTVMKPAEVMTDVDYMNNGVTYRFLPAKTGFQIVDVKKENAEVARLYPTSQKGYYIYQEESKNSFGYFNEDGDFVVERYDADGDGLANYIYKIDMNDKEMMNEEKMDKKKMKKNKMK